MKKIFFSLLLLAVISCKSQPENKSSINVEDFEKAIQNPGVQVLDVRTAKEFQSGHIKSALQSDWTNKQEFNERIKYIDKNKPVYVYCLAGGRSAAAAAWMKENGYKTVVDLKGGINAWKSENKPLEGSSNEKQLTMTEYLASIPGNKTTLVDFGAPWCPPCVKMDPVIDEIRNDKMLDFTFIKIDAGVHTDIMRELKIGPIPVFIIYKDGKEVWRKEGIVIREELAEVLR